MKFHPFAVFALALGGCGSVGPLRPPQGRPLPVKPALAQTTPTAEDLLTPPTFAAPERIDELMRRSTPRRADRFDLPPPDGTAAPLPETQQPATDAGRIQEPQ
jgi:hypothetical protein